MGISSTNIADIADIADIANWRFSPFLLAMLNDQRVTCSLKLRCWLKMREGISD